MVYITLLYVRYPNFILHILIFYLHCNETWNIIFLYFYIHFQYLVNNKLLVFSVYLRCIKSCTSKLNKNEKKKTFQSRQQFVLKFGNRNGYSWYL